MEIWIAGVLKDNVGCVRAGAIRQFLQDVCNTAAMVPTA